MIIGTGIDIIEIARIKEAMKREGFVERLFSPAEIKDSSSAQHIAGRWAAKEAIAKAMPTKITWRDVEIFNNETGAPYAKFSENINFKPSWRMNISISHEKTNAVAVAILEESETN